MTNQAIFAHRQSSEGDLNIYVLKRQNRVFPSYHPYGITVPIIVIKTLQRIQSLNAQIELLYYLTLNNLTPYSL